MKLKFIKIRYAIIIVYLRIRSVFSSVTKGFTFIEMLISLLITIIILTIIPHLFRLTDTYLSASYEFDQLEYSFFQLDLNKMTNSKAISLKLIDEHSILLKQQNQNSFIKYQNHKIIFVSNNRGNITLLNNVLNAKFISNHKGIIGVFLRIGSRENYYDKSLYL
ncbi:prepilin-type N-terminal cleavage/methylation domain-containing protein [Staphylococcus haemolyticus]|uniref:prepilin-type N-terminal cleavage/methylation domain-containing protein n=1 Tax=Staphylococcus haemolyticus TaxID=1283 RepID=UPI003F68BB3B